MKAWHRSDYPDELPAFGISARALDNQLEAIDNYPPQIVLFEMEDMRQFQEDAKLAKDPSEASSIEKVVEALNRRGQMRALMTMRPTFRDDLELLRLQFPNFSEVIDYIRCCAEIAWRTDKVLRFTPILLNGEGGVGKTMFIEAVAQWMNHGFHRISISSSQNGSDLAGSSSFFSNAKPGIPFTALIYSDTANPVIFLDEIDKNTTGQYDALGALYVLLEPSTAKSYKDQCYPLAISADHVLWIAASNDADRLSDPLRMRFRKFDVSITPAQSRTIAETIARSTLAALAPATDGMKFTEAALDSLSSLTPRRIGQAVTEAIGKAFMSNLMTIDNVYVPTPAKRRIGFLP